MRNHVPAAARRMSRFRRIPYLFLLAGCMAAWWPAAALARIEADPNKDYAITPESGSWLIIVSTYTGAESGKFAHDLCLEIRSRYDLPAFVFNRGAEERKQQEAELRARRELLLQNLRQSGYEPDRLPSLKKYKIEDNCAVLIGGYKDMEAASRDLKRIKKLDAPKTVPLDTFYVTGQDPTDKSKKKEQQTQVNPFLNSFVVRNPTIKAEQEPEKPDAFLKELNSGEKYSLLQVKKPWTLMVKEYQGATMLQPQSQGDFMKRLVGERKQSMLEAGGLQAHEIARFLREKMNIDAYVLHTRWSSVVTVGAFDAPNDPRLLQYQKTFANMRWSAQVGPDIEFSTNPLPMRVPQP